MEKIELNVNRALYSKEIILKAAYHFIDKYYMHIDCSTDEFFVTIIPKENVPLGNVALEFENEMLAQAVRYTIYQQTHTIRELLLARAMASTINGTVDIEQTMDEIPDDETSLDNILMDWFENNER